MFLRILSIFCLISCLIHGAVLQSESGKDEVAVEEVPRNTQGISIDRTLHVRGIPAIPGYQSNLYEVYMEPYLFGVRPLFAAALLQPETEGDDAAAADESASTVKGDLFFTQPQPPHGPVIIKGNITGLSPGKHGLHIHEFGDLRKGCTSVGGHYNPFQLQHGGPRDGLRHAGDLGNIEAGEDGTAEVKIIDPLLSLAGGIRGIIGRSIVIDSKEDDLGRSGTVDSIVSGSSGPRIACGIIGFVN